LAARVGEAYKVRNFERLGTGSRFKGGLRHGINHRAALIYVWYNQSRTEDWASRWKRIGAITGDALTAACHNISRIHEIGS
jgi:hypothetical protein